MAQALILYRYNANEYHTPTLIFEMLSPERAPVLILIGLAAWLSYVLCIIIYRLFFHELSRYPGPWLAHVTRLRFSLYNLRGQHIYDTKRLHEKYGEVVRVAPDELSYTATPAWKDVQGHRPGRGELEKDHVFFDAISAGPTALPALKKKRHGEIRRLVSHSFSALALKDQEPVIQGYVDLFIRKLYETSDDGARIVDMAGWFNVKASAHYSYIR